MKMVKVRIAVVVDSDGNWEAAGWDNSGVGVDQSGDMEENAQRELTERCFSSRSLPQRTVWITAEVPIPEAPPILEIEGTVEAES